MKTFCVTIIIALFLFFCTERTKAQTVTDIDGNIYQTVTIGTQVWMSENLKSLHYSDNTAINYVWSYNNSDSLAAIYGPSGKLILRRQLNQQESIIDIRDLP